jgi:hypothetical protein
LFPSGDHTGVLDAQDAGNLNLLQSSGFPILPETIGEICGGSAWHILLEKLLTSSFSQRNETPIREEKLPAEANRIVIVEEDETNKHHHSGWGEFASETHSGHRHVCAQRRFSLCLNDSTVIFTHNREGMVY